MGDGSGTPGIETGIQLRVKDAKAAYELMTGRGLKLQPIRTGDDGTCGFTVVDPDENKLDVAQIAAD